MYILSYSCISLALYTIPFQVVNVILNGRPNKKFPDKFNVDIDTWSQGALEALSVVTRQLKVLQLLTLLYQMQEYFQQAVGGAGWSYVSKMY